ncbi:hypothetical protein BU25DRAFT_410068 [Macroventuria anomochaeta]|uniref:Uncharacterized protein n=1 Tax=Macroventuria anomochaeta TaxID=301207 RepID=A0ACB6S534_9PLEO|nr:uncharacterized protein BU25DRAFT_410068 [Macroventuria anomochaeta]KAF2628499.1 hypothetical protein BU25DRAFT_410068 [Macroventuria anomochaeta]
MSVQGNLQRPRSASWKVEAIRRGDLKISGPIPIEENTPLSDEEEREFAERRGEKRIEEALDVPVPHQHMIRQVPNSQGTLRQEDVTEEIAMKTASRDQDFARQELELHDQHPARSPLRSPLGMHPTDGILAGQRESVFQPRSHTPPTPFRATPESTSHSNATVNAKKQKRKSGIRGVFRKMFGRKDREESQEHNVERNEEPVRRGHSYHHSDPGMLQKSQTAPQQQPPTPSTQRISDLTVKELQPPHPLGQHLPYPMNVNAPPASPPHEYLRFDFQRPDLGPRRATLPNLPGGVAQRHSLDEPRGRLSTWEERTEDEPVPSPGIGIALSSPPHAARNSIGDRRRSRSAGALRELAKARFSNDDSTTRNDVIKSWRESYASASVYSQNTRPQTARTVETMRSVHTKGPTVQEAESIHEGMSATLVGPDDLTPNEPTPRAQGPSTPEAAPRAQDWETPEHPPVSAFNFGNLEPSSPHEHPETLAQLEGPPLPSRSPKRLSVEDRVQNLEENIHALESSLRRISTHNNRQTIILESAPRNLRTRTRSTSRSVSAVSIHQREPLPAGGAPTSNLAYESSPPSPPLTHTEDTKTTKEDLASLHTLLSDERTARLALESRVLALQTEVSTLHNLVNKLINRSTVAVTSPNYPTPSPDSIHPGTEDCMPTPKQGRYGARRQGTEDSEVVSPEVWATPKEESFEVDNRSQYFYGNGAEEKR